MAKRSRLDSSASISQPQIGPKYAHIDDDDSGNQSYVMQCFLPPHAPMNFESYGEYDEHYQSYHTHRCASCHKNLPSDHLLNLHIRENHDSLVAAQKARGDKIYSCFLEDCDRQCSTPQKRRMHLVDKHHFPKDYNFFVINDGLDNRNSMLRSSIKKQTSKPSAEIGEEASSSHNNIEDPSEAASENIEAVNAAKNNDIDESVDSLTSSMSALRFVPSSVRFGRGRSRGFAKR